ncbi:remodeling and spacing factor 1 [Synchiropus splendidus]|uniref:remodeling and spacing factor 1 n=1 Tax=Synchiropus splendidus TaxID=270530 RepID=UPI00237E3B58|nr:remodeling and spacing factor 1 [Synchiropus splendidus]
MAATPVVSSSGPALCPSFAVVCSFLERYGAALDLPEMTFPEMEEYLRDKTTVPKPLIELHVKLLRKLGKSVTPDRWEKYLAKMCQDLNSTWAWELEQNGYQEMSIECKSSILKYLCECQFDDNLKFKMAINEEEPEKMRLQPIGRDRQGLMYWLQLDQEQNIRLYTEEQDDIDGSTWQCIVRTRNDLADALELLKSQLSPEQTQNQDQEQALSGSGSPTERAAEGDKCVGSTAGPTTEEGEKKVVKEEGALTQVSPDSAAASIKQENSAEDRKDLEVPSVDNRVSTITVVKSESRDCDALKNAVSVVMPPGSVVPKQEVSKGEEAERAVVRSNQQAKIPLKKRELKLAESFHSNHLNNTNNSSSIIVCNPSVIQTQDSQVAAAPPSGLAATQQPPGNRPELTNGRASVLLSHKEAQNGVIIGHVGHVGVIRSAPELSRIPAAELQNGPEHQSCRGPDEEMEGSRQSVLVRKCQVSEESKIPTGEAEDGGQQDKEASSPNSVQTGSGPGVDAEKDKLDPEQKEEHNHEETGSTLEKQEAEDSTVSFTSTEVQGEGGSKGVNGGVATQNRAKESGSKAGREQASSELQKEGIRLKIKIPPHRRNKRKEKVAKEQSASEEGASLRRSARISRPSPKASDDQKEKPEKKQSKKSKKEDEEEEEEEEREEEPRSRNQNKPEPAESSGKRRGRKRNRRPRWTNIRAKRQKPNEDEDRGEQSEGGSGSEQSCKLEEIPSEDACSHCGLPNHPELILLCDSCDHGYHTACLRPPLMLIPDGEWFCPPCQHKLLCERLEEQLQNLDSVLKKKERAERRRERLVYVGISVENIINPDGEEAEEEKFLKKKDPKKSKNLGRRSTRTRKNISYRFDDFDDAIDEAIVEDDDCSVPGRRLAAVLSASEKRGPASSPARSTQSKKRRRLNDLESDSTAVESEDEFMLSNSSEEDFAASAGEEDEEEEDAGSDGGSWDGTKRSRGTAKTGTKPGRMQQKGRRRGRRRHSSEEEEDTDEDIDSDQYSDRSDSDADKKRGGLRRGHRQQVNYRETSDSSDNSCGSNKKVKQARPRGRPRKERLSSDYSDASTSSRDSEEDYQDEDEDEGRGRRRREDEDLDRKQQRDEERRRLHKRKMLGKLEDEEKRSRARTDVEDPEKMGRGKRREILMLQRRKRLAQMLKKRRPSTDEDESESDDSESTSSEDRPVRKRLNRIDSDDDEDEEEDDDDEEEEKDGNDEAQVKEAGHASPPSHGSQSCRTSDAPKDSGELDKHNGPTQEEDEGGEGTGRTDSVHSDQNSPQS